ncbi:carboxymuconolactone decarboxylase family protein [bacterium]|nr:carboxymuconolactone decarboxylase family protein [bacterium]
MDTYNPDAFDNERRRLQELLQSLAGRDMKRFLTLDHQVYEDSALPARTKELLGLAASTALRCDDCICYHLRRARELGVSTEEVIDCFSVAMIVGGSVTIPHVRRALALWQEWP